MSQRNSLKKVCMVLLIANPLSGLLEPQAANVKISSTISEAQILAAENNSKPNKLKQGEPEKSSYKVDGSTSASKLVANRSHSVSKQDETGLAIFLGVIVIGVIIFFLNPFDKKK